MAEKFEIVGSVKAIRLTKAKNIFARSKFTCSLLRKDVLRCNKICLLESLFVHFIYQNGRCKKFFGKKSNSL